MARQGLVKRSYDDFEPFCRWERSPDVDILHVHLQGFKKQQLKIQLNRVGGMTITGERCLDSNHNDRWARFAKETRVPNEINTNAIHAKLSSGILSIFMPKNATLLLQQPPESADGEHNQPQQVSETEHQYQQKGDSKPDVGDSSHQKEYHWMMKLNDTALVRGKSGILAAAVVVIVAVGAVLVGYRLRTSYSNALWEK